MTPPYRLGLKGLKSESKPTLFMNCKPALDEALECGDLVAALTLDLHNACRDEKLYSRCG